MFRAKQLKAALVAAPLALASVSASAAFLDFQVQEGSVLGSGVNLFTADKITGNYVEVVTFTPTGPNTGMFTTSIKWEAGQFVADDGVNPVKTQLNSFGASGYGLYGLLTAGGTFSTVGGVTSFTFLAGSGSLNVFLDPLDDTTFTAPASGAASWTTASNGEDILIATGGMLSGAGTLDPTLSSCSPNLPGGINCGSFGTQTSFFLTDPAGKSYFVSPNPFFNLSFQSGQLNNFTVSGTQTINGSLDVVFGRTSVPVPATLGLFGAGLLGLGAMVRRKA
jgi:hypothetical protein